MCAYIPMYAYVYTYVCGVEMVVGVCPKLFLLFIYSFYFWAFIVIYIYFTNFAQILDHFEADDHKRGGILCFSLI
jgi:hypothetical protein